MLDLSQALLLGLVAAAGYIMYRGSRHDPREPPILSNRIPIVGHMLGMMWYGVGYWTMQAKQKASYSIFGIDLLFTKIYIITSPELMQSVQRSKSLSLDPLLDLAVLRFSGITNKQTLDLMLDASSGGQGFAQKLMHALAPTMIGKSLDQMNIRMVRFMTPLIDELGDKSSVDLYKWCRDAITDASNDTMFGPMNPFKDKELSDAFWDYENNLGALVANALPWLTARKPLKAREKIAAAILKYHQSGGVEQASELVKLRHTSILGAGISPEEYALLETPLPTGFLSNTVPAAFWSLYDIYCRPELLNDLRKEVELNALSIRTNGTHIIDIGALRGRCPLLLSTFQEILRTRTMSSPTRYVTQDTLIADKYLLKAASLVTMPSIEMGKQPEVWGETANVFDAQRFMKGVASETRPSEREPRRLGGFMTFGVSPTICPGRHFASSEILGMVATMILQYDISPVCGTWEEPEKFLSSLVSIMTPVRGAFPVNVKRRRQYEDTKWDFHVEEGKGQFPLVIG
ncbi:hypothetical protein N7476_011197 [Penicillium atrosanguineum]|uniref:Cytochrome P450 n=1 Tax=Penicillium atrosanguineum TaxID=1132637 RepID=A0A9W9PM35_9EURO|nr:hypothetical protein N7526_010479 [Penicillium atrosanguineum]KAJ5299640.1 hypothetical protein N7476_011197 [Penicillium atrosanguineum]